MKPSLAVKALPAPQVAGFATLMAAAAFVMFHVRAFEQRNTPVAIGSPETIAAVVAGIAIAVLGVTTAQRISSRRDFKAVLMSVAVALVAADVGAGLIGRMFA